MCIDVMKTQEELSTIVKKNVYTILAFFRWVGRIYVFQLKNILVDILLQQSQMKKQIRHSIYKLWQNEITWTFEALNLGREAREQYLVWKGMSEISSHVPPQLSHCKIVEFFIFIFIFWGEIVEIFWSWRVQFNAFIHVRLLL